MPVFGPTRAALAAAAARGADILPSLRLVLTAEALTAPPPAAGAGAERRIGRAVRRRAGAGRLPRRVAVFLPGTDAPLPAAVPRGLLQGTVLTFLRGVLRSEGRAVVRLLPQGDSRRAGLAGRQPRADARRPARAAAPLRAVCDRRRGGGTPQRCGCALSPTLPLTPPPDADALVLDRYSPSRVYLQGFCVEDVE